MERCSCAWGGEDGAHLDAPPALLELVLPQALLLIASRLEVELPGEGGAVVGGEMLLCPVEPRGCSMPEPEEDARTPGAAVSAEVAFTVVDFAAVVVVVVLLLSCLIVQPSWRIF